MTITPEALKELRLAEEIKQLNGLISAADVDAIVLPAGYEIAHLERYRDGRERLTGKMETPSIDSFEDYINSFSPEGNKTLVFVDQKTMTARSALNFGTTDKPGHADHLAMLKLEMTAEYKSMLRAAESGGRSAQKATAEWCEDHISFISFYGESLDGDQIEAARAIKAIRNLKIEDQRKVDSGVGNFNRERTLMESTKVDTSEGLPHFIRFTCVPYQGLAQRVFTIRLGSGQGPGGDPVFTFQIVRHDIEVQEMAEELANLIRGRMGGMVQVYLGAFSK